MTDIWIGRQRWKGTSETYLAAANDDDFFASDLPGKDQAAASLYLGKSSLRRRHCSLITVRLAQAILLFRLPALEPLGSHDDGAEGDNG